MASCVAFGCNNKPYKTLPNISFHAFPSDEPRRSKWIMAVRRKDWMPNKYSRLCSLHFEENLFDRSMHRVYLYPNAVPSIFPGYPEHLQKACKPHLEESDITFVARTDHLETTTDLLDDNHLKKNAINQSISLDKEINPAKKRGRRKRRRNSRKTPSNIVNEAAKKSQMNENLVTPSGLNPFSKTPNEIRSSQTQSSVYIKIEKPWEKEYNYVFNPADSKFKDYDETQIKINNVQSVSHNDSKSNSVEKAGKNSLKTPRGSSVSMYEKPLKIRKRDELFGKLVASEISDLYDNSELYAKTKQAVLNVLVQAHYEQMKLNI